MENWFVKWRPYQGNIETTPVKIDEYLPMGKNIILGAQHAFAMFGATILAPLLMGFDPSLTMMITGFGTILFFFCLLYTSPSPRDRQKSRMPSSA